MRARKKPSASSPVGALHEAPVTPPSTPVIVNQRRRVGAAIRIFLSRLRIAWLVLIGRIDYDAMQKAQFFLKTPVNVLAAPLAPIHLRATWWTSCEDKEYTKTLIRRELGERVADYIVFTENAETLSGSEMTGDLYVYQKGKECIRC